MSAADGGGQPVEYEVVKEAPSCGGQGGPSAGEALSGAGAGSKGAAEARGEADRTVAAGSGAGSEAALSPQDQAIFDALVRAKDAEEEGNWHAALVAGSKGMQLWRAKRFAPASRGPAVEIELVQEGEGWRAIVLWPCFKVWLKGEVAPSKRAARLSAKREAAQWLVRTIGELCDKVVSGELREAERRV